MKRLFCRCSGRWLFGAIFIMLFLVGSVAFREGTSVADTLTVTTSGPGTGTVNSVPSGIACTSGNSANCSAVFTNNSSITLAATPDWKSLFGGWGGPCSGTGDCVFVISGDSGVTATFNPNYQAALIITLPELQPEFSSLAAAYEYAHAAGKNDFILAAREFTFFEDLILSHERAFTLDGGKNSGYLTNVGYTTLQGSLDIQQGSVSIDSLIIQ